MSEAVANVFAPKSARDKSKRSPEMLSYIRNLKSGTEPNHIRPDRCGFGDDSPERADAWACFWYAKKLQRKAKR